MSLNTVECLYDLKFRFTLQNLQQSSHINTTTYYTLAPSISKKVIIICNEVYDYIMLTCIEFNFS
jgi:hypothetical protein